MKLQIGWPICLLLFSLAVGFPSALRGQGSLQFQSALSVSGTFPGHLFELEATEAIRIWRVGMHFSDTTTRTVNLWYRPGGKGLGANDTGWIPIGSTSVSPTQTALPTQIAVDINQVVTPSNMIGIAIMCQTGNLRYAGGAATDPPQTAWGISIPPTAEGFQVAAAPPWPTQQTPRRFAGAIWYDPAGPMLTVDAEPGVAQGVYSTEEGPGNAGFAAGKFSIEANDDAGIASAALTAIEVQADGTGNDGNAFIEVAIFRDDDNSGTFDPALDVKVGISNNFVVDDGTISFSIPAGTERQFATNQEKTYFIVVRLAGTASPGDTFRFTISVCARYRCPLGPE